jgi:hypothetical protein
VTTESTSKPLSLVASPWHTVVVLVAVGINAYYGTIRSAQQRAGSGPTRPHIYLRAMLFEFVVLAIVLLAFDCAAVPSKWFLARIGVPSGS